MTTPQILVLGVLAAMMAAFVWGRFRYDVVAVATLLTSVVVGIVPADRAFIGFSDEIVVIVASALVLSAAVSRSGLIDRAVAGIGPYLKREGVQVVALSGLVAALSGFVKNIGALAMLMPVAFQLAARGGGSPSALLMPMSFGALLGGVITLIGTSPNIIVSRMRDELVGAPFGFFDFAPVGLGVTIAGLAFLAVGYRLLPERKSAGGVEVAFNVTGYTTEAQVPAGSRAVGETVEAFEIASERSVTVTAIVRRRRFEPARDEAIRADDLLVLEGEPAALERVVAQAGLTLMRDTKTPEKDDPGDEIGVMEAVVTADSPVVDRTALALRLFERHQVNLLAIGRRGERIARRIRSVALRPGDMVVLQGNLKRLPDVMADLGLLPLAERELPLGRRRNVIPAAALAAAMVGVTAFGLPVGLTFMAAALAVVVFGALSVREATDAIDWPILILLGALIPVSEAVRTTGVTDVVAGWLAAVAVHLPALGAVALVMIAAMAVTPFLNNAATVLVMAPISVSLAARLDLSPDPFLMAVALGAACDFLTPIGHQCNTLVMGPGGYRFGDYARLGAPLSLVVICVGLPLIVLTWPLAR